MRNIHTPRGIHAHKDASSAWEWMVQDGLGSLRGVADHSAAVLWSGSPAPYGGYFDETGTRQTHYGFTGEPTDGNGLLYLRARYYNPAAGVFTARDPFEGVATRPMSLNGYSWVEGNPINFIDPSGECVSEQVQIFLQHNASYRILVAAGVVSSVECEAYPGWRYSSRSVSTMTICENDRTLHPYGVCFAADLPAWWTRLSSTEREIEEALTATNTDTCRYNAKLENLLSFSFVSEWILSNKMLIQDISGSVRVRPALVAGILASEMLFDYGSDDKLADSLARFSPNGGYGYSNAHALARSSAYNYIRPLIDMGAVEPVPTRVVGTDVVTARWLTGDEGAIWATATVARWLVDPFTGNAGLEYETAQELSPEDMALIWTAYRAGVKELDTIGQAWKTVQEFRDARDNPSGSCNAIMSLPVMKYVNSLFL